MAASPHASSLPAGFYVVDLPPDSPESVAWDQVPPPASGALNLFIGRKCKSNCSSSGQPPVFELIVASMNWASHSLKIENYKVFDPPRTIVGGFVIRTAYDPTLFWSHDEMWVAFECSDWDRLGASVCMGPIVQHDAGVDSEDASGRSWYVDSARTTVVVKNSCDGTLCHSASVPKLFHWHNIPYLYYTAVHSREVAGRAGNWTGASTEGVRLQDSVEKAGRIYWSAGARSTVASADSTATEVMQVDLNDASSNQFADGTGVYVMGRPGAETSLIMTGGLGGYTNVSCLLAPQGLNPESDGCYRQFIARATTPLGVGIFNDMRVSELENFMPPNFSQYVRRFFDLTGQSMLWGSYVSSTGDGSRTWVGPSGKMWAYPLDLSTLTFHARPFRQRNLPSN